MSRPTTTGSTTLNIATSRKVAKAKAAAVAAGAASAAIANSPVEGEPLNGAVIEVSDPAGKVSMLDLVVAEYNLHKQYRCARVLIGAQVADGLNDPDGQCLGIQEAFVRDHSAETSLDTRVTGALFVINKKAICLLLEARAGAILACMKALLASPVIKQPRVLHFSEDVPREFRTNVFRAFSLPADEFQPPLKGDSGDAQWVALNFELLKNMLELGHEVSTMPVDKAHEFIKLSGSRQFMAKVPSAEKILGVCTCPNIFSVQEYLSFIEGSTVIFESELTYPAEPYADF